MKPNKTVKTEQKCIGYARISTVDQNLAMQLDGLNSYGCENIYEDEGVSGGIHPFKRRGFKTALKQLNDGDVLVVWKLDRLGRSLRGIIDTCDHLQERGIQFVSLTENIDTTTVMGRAFLHFLGLLAELERGLIKERTLHGLAAARRRGQKLGRPFALGNEELREAHVAIAAGGVNVADMAKNYGVSHRTMQRGFKRLGLLW